MREENDMTGLGKYGSWDPSVITIDNDFIDKLQEISQCHLCDDELINIARLADDFHDKIWEEINCGMISIKKKLDEQNSLTHKDFLCLMDMFKALFSKNGAHEYIGKLTDENFDVLYELKQKLENILMMENDDG